MTDAELDAIIEAGTWRYVVAPGGWVTMRRQLAADLVHAARELRELPATSRDGAL